MLMLAVAMSTLATSTFIIETMHRICAPAAPVLLEALEPLSAANMRRFASLDSVSVDGKSVVPGARTIVRQNQSVEVRGWAMDPTTGANAASVFLVVDTGPAFRATYGGSEAGSTKAQASRRPPRTGFYGVVPTQSLTLGAHLIHVRVVAINLSGFYEASKPISVSVR